MRLDGNKPTILVLSAVDPCPPTQGDEVRLYGLLEAAREMGAATLALWSRDRKPGAKPVPVRYYPLHKGRMARGVVWSLLHGRPLPVGPYAQAFPAVPGAWDVVVAFQWKTWRWAKAVPARVRILELTDSMSLYRSFAELPWAKRWQLLGAQGEEREAASAFDRVWVCAEQDREWLLRFGVVSEVIPNGPLRVKALPPPEDDRALLFVGNLRYPPNRQGLIRFLRTVWPGLAARGYRLHLVGQGTDRVRDVPGVQGHGRVMDVEPYYQQSAIAVSPVAWGSGSPMKVWEALGYGRPVVALARRCRGRPSGDEIPGLVCVAGETAEDWAAGLDRARQQPPLRGGLAPQAQAFCRGFASLSHLGFEGNDGRSGPGIPCGTQVLDPGDEALGPRQAERVP